MDDERLKTQIGANIASYRKRAGLTQAGLAEKLNYSDKAVSKWERGESVPDVLTMVQLADHRDLHNAVVLLGTAGKQAKAHHCNEDQTNQLFHNICLLRSCRFYSIWRESDLVSPSTFGSLHKKSSQIDSCGGSIPQHYNNPNALKKQPLY